MSTDAANIQALLDRITEGRASDDDLRRLKALLLGEHIYQSATGSNIAQAVDHSNATVNVTNNYYSQQSLTSLTPLQIYEACKKLADSSKLSIGLESTIIRKGVIAELDDFILSSSRYAAILGGSGVGKTVVMAQAVQHFLNLRWGSPPYERANVFIKLCG
ncbi:MAG: hypothetical protein HC893_12120 [Chloroflexaceae bacterium]|nr:hypothetical protein [Chloroflexaceae bacterium]